jgi:hypothetical protein
MHKIDRRKALTVVAAAPAKVTGPGASCAQRPGAVNLLTATTCHRNQCEEVPMTDKSPTTNPSASNVSRRSVTTGIVAAVTAIPAVALSVRSSPRDDKLLAVIRSYKSEITAINASGDLSDDELDAWVDRADAILMEAAGLPALTAASAVAALELVVAEGQVGSHSVYGERFVELVRAARDYIALTVQA